MAVCAKSRMKTLYTEYTMETRGLRYSYTPDSVKVQTKSLTTRFLFKDLFLFMYMWHMHTEAREPRRGHQISWSRSHRRCQTWVPGAKRGCSGEGKRGSQLNSHLVGLPNQVLLGHEHFLLKLTKKKMKIVYSLLSTYLEHKESALAVYFWPHF